MKKYSGIDRLKYRFDNRMARGSLGVIRILVIATVIMALIIGGLLFAAREYDSVYDSLTDTIAAIINAEMPYSDSERGPAYIILLSAAGIFGLLLTSVLIGLISSAIEEKVDALKRGNSVVLEKGHTVVLGFKAGEYTLLNQLILAAANRKTCIVVAEDMPRDEMEDAIRDNLTHGNNIRIICRTADIFDPVSLEKCSIRDCRSVIISPTDDASTIKALLAVSTIIDSEDIDVKVGAIVTNAKFRFPASLAAKHNVTTLHTADIIARMIAHTCTQEGLSETFREVFNFEGSEFYCVDMPEAAGLQFWQIVCRMKNAVPVGFMSESGHILNPDPCRIPAEGERLIVLEREPGDAVLGRMPELPDFETLHSGNVSVQPERPVAIIGYNRYIGIVLSELPENVFDLVFVGLTEEQKNDVIKKASVREGFRIAFCDDDLSQEENLLNLCSRVGHAAILSDYELPEEDADMNSISKIIHLRDIRERYGLRLNITAEMRRERNQRLIDIDDNTDFIVASNMSSLFLAQLAENMELRSVFNELLSNEGNELFIRYASSFSLSGRMTVAQIRQAVLKSGYIFLGINRRKGNNFENIFNPPRDDVFDISGDDGMIVLGLN